MIVGKSKYICSQTLTFVPVNNQFPYKYMVSFTKCGKVYEQEFCCTKDEVNVLSALAHSKGREVVIYNMDWVKYKEKTIVEANPDIKPENKSIKQTWNKGVRCVETGKVYSSVSECSIDTGVNYRSLINAIKNGNPRNGLHFVSDTSPSVKTRKRRKKSHSCARSQKYICVTTNQTFGSAGECMAFCGAPVTSFYRALKQRRAINGLLFEKL